MVGQYRRKVLWHKYEACESCGASRQRPCIKLSDHNATAKTNPAAPHPGRKRIKVRQRYYVDRLPVGFGVRTAEGDAYWVVRDRQNGGQRPPGLDAHAHKHDALTECEELNEGEKQSGT
jgi:hypothetical protein